MEEFIPLPTSPRMTEKQYLRMEETSDVRHEYRDGQIVDMAGGTWEHGVIASNLRGEFRSRLKGKPCRAVGSDVRVLIPGKGEYCYPDVTVVCGPPAFSPAGKKTTITNPKVAIEVTSESSEKDDLVDKFAGYRRLESLAEYLVVSQDRPRVRAFYRLPDGLWAFGPTYTQLDQSVAFASLEIQIPMNEIYADVEFPPAPAEASRGEATPEVPTA